MHQINLIKIILIIMILVIAKNINKNKIIKFIKKIKKYYKKKIPFNDTIHSTKLSNNNISLNDNTLLNVNFKHKINMIPYAANQTNIISSLTPQIIRQVYNIVPIVPTRIIPLIAIIGCFVNNKLQSDFNAWTKYYGLPTKKINIINLGTSVATGNNLGWYLEMCLDVQAVYTACPTANIYVICAKSPSFIDIRNAIAKANSIGAHVISMSLGASEPTSTQYNAGVSLESVFNSNACSYLASTGDYDLPGYPALSPNVLAIGGTTLNVIKEGNTYIRQSEQTWCDAGAGFSTYFSQPSYQQNISQLVGQKRCIPDIVADANQATGLRVYCSNYKNGYTWYTVGGTSLSCPLNAGLIANANILRFNSQKSSLSTSLGSSYKLQTSIYNIYKNNPTQYSNYFYDITSGLPDNNYNATNGYDIATGIGAPNFNNLAIYLSSV